MNDAVLKQLVIQLGLTDFLKYLCNINLILQSIKY